MITPKEAAERRNIRLSTHYKDAVKEIDSLLCGPPNRGNVWVYEMPALRDDGACKRAVAEDYERAGWRVSYTEANTIVISEKVDAQ